MSIRAFLADEGVWGLRDGEGPLLLASCGPDFGTHQICRVPHLQCFRVTLPEFRGNLVTVASYGWLVMLQPESRECSLYNPVSHERIQLPNLPIRFTYHQCVLSKPPTEPDCFALFNDNFSLISCRIGDQVYRSVRYGYLGSIASVHGQIYGFKEEGIETIHFEGENVQFRRMEVQMMNGAMFAHFGRIRSYHTWIIECHDAESQFFIVQKLIPGSANDHHEEFRVFQVDTLEMSCIRVGNIGDRTLFLPNYGGGAWCCGPAEGIQPNCIYYLDYGIGDRVFHVFDLVRGGRSTHRLPRQAIGRSNTLITWVDKSILSNTWGW